MIPPVTLNPTVPAVGPLQAAFLTLLPIVRSVAGAYFRDVICADRREDSICEVIALAWAWHRRLVQKGRDPATFPVALARLAARSVASGRRLAGQERANDALSPVCRRRRGFAIVGFPVGAPEAGTEIADALADNTRTPVPVQVQFRCDFPVWRDSLPAKKRFVADQLALGHRPGEVAAAVDVSPARISQIREELRHDYLHFLTGPAHK